MSWHRDGTNRQDQCHEDSQASNGALTIVALAQEADVPRNALTQRHLDLKNEFCTRVKQRGGTPDVEVRLRKTITQLKKTIANKNAALDQLRADVPALVRTINQLTLENQQLRQELAQPTSHVVALRQQPVPVQARDVPDSDRSVVALDGS
ncbi:hypothetical protein ABZS76_08110 [Streptomyces sp. NPDC005562]|uniref:hypothetical protein n=1 Tax=Streptomyces sp. NPDC005562 TaxID=3154890 RepID=UPI0033A782B8